MLRLSLCSQQESISQIPSIPKTGLESLKLVSNINQVWGRKETQISVWNIQPHG